MIDFELTPKMKQARDMVHSFAETFIRERIRELPDGVYYGEDSFEDRSFDHKRLSYAP